MDMKQINKIQKVLDEVTERKLIAGLNVLIYKDGREIGYFESGMADIEGKRNWSRDTISRLFSMSKPVTAVAAMILLERGQLDLADEVGWYIPEFWNLKVCTEKGRNDKAKSAVRNTWRPLLIQDLLNMTSGYTYGAWCEDSPYGEHLTSDLIADLNRDVDAGGENKITTQDFAKRLAAIPASFDPGTDYNYGLSADILGAVIEKISGMKFSDFLKKEIFQPLEMRDTDFYVPAEKQARLSKVYKCIKAEDNSCQLEAFTSCNLGIQYKMDKAPSFESGGAGLCSTVDDYMKFAAMLANYGEFNGRRILKRATVEYLMGARLTPALQQRFDMKMPHLSGYTYCNLLRVAAEEGQCKVVSRKGEFGWDGWLGPYTSICPDQSLAIVMTMQRTDSGTTTAARKVHNIIYSSL